MGNILSRAPRWAERGADFRDYHPTVADLAWLFGVSSRWIARLRADGVLPADAPLPELVKRMASYRVAAIEAKRTAHRKRRRG